jgi:hypothetical protein
MIAKAYTNIIIFFEFDLAKRVNIRTVTALTVAEFNQ